MALGIEQLDDFVNSYLQKYIMGKWQDISLPLQQYYFASRLFDKAKKEEMFGSLCKWKIKVRNPDNFQVVGLYHRDSSNRVNMIDEGEMKWAMTTTNYHYDIDEEVFGQGCEQIVNYIKLREDSMMDSFFAGMEDLMFGTGPSSPTQSPNPPASLLHWITANMTDTTSNNATEGFTGVEPYGFSSVGVGGISTTDYPAWKNRAFPYAAVTHEDFVKKIIRSMDLCEFTPPIARPDIAPSRPDWELLTTLSRVEECRDLLQAGNDNIGKDLATYQNTVLIRGVPMVQVPAWQSSASINKRTDGIVLGVNWPTFKWFYKSGRSQRKRAPFQHPEMSNVRVRCMDDTGQIVCFNRRANFRGYCTSTVTEPA
jgi:hypothetical protein